MTVTVGVLLLLVLVQLHWPDTRIWTWQMTLPSLSVPIAVSPGVPAPVQVMVLSAFCSRVTPEGAVTGGGASCAAIGILMTVPVVQFPARSVEIGVTVSSPSRNGAAGVQVHPSAATEQVQRTKPCAVTRSIRDPGHRYRLKRMYASRPARTGACGDDEAFSSLPA